jgi:peptidoglycan/LPS O-acetylase OafA/YrhL
MERRYEELDSIRGLAAVTVFFLHSVILTNFLAPKYGEILSHSPLKILISGHQAVIMFFVLSGFVLSLPYLNNKNLPYSSFLIRRFCRIYIPYLFAVLFGALMRLAFSNGGIKELWSGQISWSVVLNHIFLIGMFSQNYFNPVIWSLVHEMRISIIFPIIIFIVMKNGWQLNGLIALFISCIGITLHLIYQNVDPMTNYFDTLHYMLMFFSGALLAKYRYKLINKYQNLSTLKKLMILAIGLFFYIYSVSVSSHIFNDRLLWLPTSDWGTTIGALFIIIYSLSEKKASKLLLKKPILFIGKISYSIYLYHLVIILFLLSVFQEKMNNFFIWLLSIALTLVISYFAYESIEKTSVKLGRNLSKRLPISKSKINEKSA